MGAPPMEGFLVKRSLVLIFTGCFLSACSSSFLKYDHSEQLLKNDEFENSVKIEAVKETPKSEAVTAPTPTPTPVPEVAKEVRTKKGKKQKRHKHGKAETTQVAKTESNQHEPELEDSEGLLRRRPIVDPFRVGEEVTHSVKYFKMSAGELKFKVDPMSMVNGRKAYTFLTEIKTSSFFDSVYSVDDLVETLVDFDEMIPRVFSLHVKESGQLREARMLFDDQKHSATYWEKKITKKDGAQEKKQQWDIPPFSQNVFSALFYMRIFKWDVGKEYAFRVADDEQNLIFKGKALRKEKLDTDLGEMNAVVIKPEIILKGAFKPVGDIYIWLSDDDRHYILRIESKIKIGTLVSEITALKPGG